MAHSLSSMGPPLSAAAHGIDYAPTRLQSTPDGSGSVFVYRPLKNMGLFFRGRDSQPGICCQPMVFSGCVLDMTVNQSCREFRTQHITLGLPPSPNQAAVDLKALQHTVLRNIANADVISAGRTCTVGWGSLGAQHPTPEVVISVRQEAIISRSGKRSGYSKLSFKIGDDVIVKGTIRRVDTYNGDILNMRYIIVAGMHGKLSLDQLRALSP